MHYLIYLILNKNGEEKFLFRYIMILLSRIRFNPLTAGTVSNHILKNYSQT